MYDVQKLPPATVLDDLLASEITNSSTEPLVIHAGHYALVPDLGGIVGDCLDRSQFPSIDLGFAEFSRLTWGAACRAIATTQTMDRAQLMLLVNDWQFLASERSDRTSSERAAARMREDYYRDTHTLPACHLDELNRYGLSTDAVLRDRDDRWLFSETALRSQLKAVIREIASDEQRAAAAGIRKYFNDDGEPVVDVLDGESGQFCLLYCGNTNCAGEVVSLIGTLHKRGVRRFVNIYPAQCREPVGVGTRLAYRLFDLGDFCITNIAVSGAVAGGTILHAVVERFGPDQKD